MLPERFKRVSLSVCLGLGMLTASCSGKEVAVVQQSPDIRSPDSAPSAASDPPSTAGSNVRELVKLRLLDMSGMNAETFQAVVTAPLQKRSPLVSVEAIAYSGEEDLRKRLDDEPIDLVLAPLADIEAILGAGSNDWMELSEMIRQMADNMRKIGQLPKDIDPLTGMGGLTNSTGTYGLLPKGGGASLYYNKELFDRYGVPYPQEGLTWLDAKELAKRLTRFDSGLPTIGFAADRSFIFNHLSGTLPFVDPQTDRTFFLKDEWGKWLSTLQAMYEIPGMEVEVEKFDAGKNRFIKNRDVAMWAGNFIYPPLAEHVGRISLPAFENQSPGTVSGLPSGYFFAIPKKSKHPPDALQAAIQIQTRPGPVSQFENAAGSELGKSFAEVLAGVKDLNTALREADERVEIRRKAGQIR